MSDSPPATYPWKKHFASAVSARYRRYDYERALLKASIRRDGFINGDITFSDLERGQADLDSKLILDSKRFRGCAVPTVNFI